MALQKISQALTKIFDEENTRIVFWNDPDGEFTAVIDELELPDVTIVNLEEVGALDVKIRLEQEDTDGRYLLYSPSEEPEYDDDWLLDIRLYSRSFRADRASIILDELGLTRRQLYRHIAARRKFFDAKERLRKLKNFVDPSDDESALDRKMLAVVSRAPRAEPFSIVCTLFHSMAEDREIDLERVPSSWEQIERFDLEKPFWQMVETSFGYREDSPSLRNLLIRLMVSDYAYSLNGELPAAFHHLQLPRTGSANAKVCLDQWRDSSSIGESFSRLSAVVGGVLHITDVIDGTSIEDLIDVMTFFEVEKEIVRALLGRVASTTGMVDVRGIRDVVSLRQAGYWVSSLTIPEAQRQARHAVYEAGAVAAEFFALRNEHDRGFSFDAPSEMYAAYESGLYRFDQLYRLFCHNADIANSRGWDMLKSLHEQVEACYCNFFLAGIALAWDRHVGSGLLDRWRIEGVENQYEFFDRHVRPWLDRGDRRRAYVVISDALRYEVAQELTARLNATYRIEAELASQLGVLPSYTALGMAALLPHRTLGYDRNGSVVVDGKPVASSAQRNGILAGVEGVVVKAADLIAMKKEEGRSFVADQRVVYVYHNRIDATGDRADTERDTFDAVNTAMTELVDLVRYIVNNLNGHYVVVTADHGFLFTETPPNETDRSKLTGKPAGTVTAKKRYLLGYDLPEFEDAWHGRTANTAEAEGGMEFWIPKGTNRFHFTGGARFIHGGAMLQEVVIPVVTVKHVKTERGRERTRTRHVTVQVVGSKHKITAPKHRFQLIQMEPVGGRTKAITLKVAVYEGNDPVTTIETLTFDSTSDNIDERQKQVILTLQGRRFDKHTPYRLVLRDAETDIEQQSVEVTIDRAITDDFDF